MNEGGKRWILRGYVTVRSRFSTTRDLKLLLPDGIV